jgi:hypothetical protein
MMSDPKDEMHCQICGAVAGHAPYRFTVGHDDGRVFHCMAVACCVEHLAQAVAVETGKVIKANDTEAT